jgi:hypothetical protein
MRNLYVIVVLAPRSRTRVLRRKTSRRPQAEIGVGMTLRVKGRTLRVHAVERRVEARDGTLEHVTEVFTRLAVPRQPRKRVIPDNVLHMPTPDDSVVAEFLRYHVLVRVFDGDADAWLATLRQDPQEGADDGDVRFVRWIRSRLRQDPALIVSIRRMVDATPFWHAQA